MTQTDSIELTVRGVLLDIEGTTSSISFVHDVMFPFVRQRLEQFLSATMHRADVKAACNQIARDSGHVSTADWASSTNDSERSLVIAEVHRLMDGDVKATGLKALQGLIWRMDFMTDNYVHMFTLKSFRRSNPGAIAAWTSVSTPQAASQHRSCSSVMSTAWAIA